MAPSHPMLEWGHFGLEEAGLTCLSPGESTGCSASLRRYTEWKYQGIGGG